MITREDAKLCVGKGWHKLLDTLYDNKPKDTLVMQVKEKFGGLRFYISTGLNEFLVLVDKIEDESEKTCEECGKPGEPTGTGWIKTLCDDCKISAQK